MSFTPHPVLRDLVDVELRRSRRLKWAETPSDILPAWVAEMDFAVADVIVDALQNAIRSEVFGYSSKCDRADVASSFSSFARARWSWSVDPGRLLLVADVTEGIALCLATLAEPGPVIVPTPAYPPFLTIVRNSGHRLVTIALDPGAPVAEHDLDAIEECFRRGARTIILCNPHNPWGRSFSRAELIAFRDVADRYGALVIADEIHAPLTLPGAKHTPYDMVTGDGSRNVTVTSATKAWNIAGLKCAEVICKDDATMDMLSRASEFSAPSSLGVVATCAAYTDGGPWLNATIERLDSNRALFRELIDTYLPEVRMRRLEATYLAWLDARAYDIPSPGNVAFRDGKVWVDHREWGPGGVGHVRVNLATSADRLQEIVQRLATAWRP